MSERPLTADDFGTFFRDIHGVEPFPWQQRLATQVLTAGKWPEVIDLPTGTGKTAVVDIAVFALAIRPDIFPRRIVFVIDRRIVVDQVCERAHRIRQRIKEGGTDTLNQVREELQKLSDADEPLGVAALRGGIPMDNHWSREPSQPWVLVSTVDQFGSRLLFRGYGVTRTMRPIYAGLAGNDCLVILDEVHLSTPFAETLSQVHMFEPDMLPRRFTIVEMSATPNNPTAPRFQLDPKSDLEDCEELRRRVSARKEAELVSVPNHNAIPKRVVRLVKSMTRTKGRSRDVSGFEGVSSVGVVVNRVRVARETYQALKEEGYSAYLLTGRMRSLDKIDALEDVLKHVDPTLGPDTDAKPGEITVIVATQAIEVGADFNFDAMITECAAIDSLQQRFGRLDRRGRYYHRMRQPARAWIIGPKSVVSAKKPDPVYGESAKVTWKELKGRAKDGRIDIGSRSLAEFPEEAKAPTASAPLVMRTHMDAWVQTSPEPVAQPLLEWFLHGMEQRASPDVSIVWRHDRSAETLRLVPPRQVEFLQVPIGAAKSWLAEGREGQEVDIVDVATGEAEESGPPSGSRFDDVHCFRWERRLKKGERIPVAAIRPGDIIIVDPDDGGIGGRTWDPSSDEPVDDLGDYAQLVYGRRATLRLDKRLESLLPPTPGEEVEADEPASERIYTWLERIRAGLTDRSDSEAYPPGFAGLVNKIGTNPVIATVGLGADNPETKPYYVLLQRQQTSYGSPPHREAPPRIDETLFDGSDESQSMIGTAATLRSHLDGVSDGAGCFAKRLGLPPKIVSDLRLAGRLHDIGKVDRRFQDKLVGGDPIALELLSEPLAKSVRGTRQTRRYTPGRYRPGGSRYPRGTRHEIASLALLESHSTVLESAHDKDLVLHLIATHHGHARPLPPIEEDKEPQRLEYDFEGRILQVNSNFADSSLAQEMSDRFWRLVRRYGYYGLAWIETILRLADFRQSAAEDQQNAERPRR